MTRYAREIERELLEGGEVPPPASSFGQNGCIGAWRVGREIGKGASGTSRLFFSFVSSEPDGCELMIGRVRIAKNADTNIYAAMKVIDKAAPERETVCSIATATSKEEDKCEKVKHSIEREVVIMKLIQHPNVIQLYDVYEDSENM